MLFLQTITILGVTMKRIIGALVFSFAVSGCSTMDMLAHESGVQVTQEQMATFKPGVTKQKDVVASLGLPSRKESIKGRETWYYDYNKIRQVGANVSESAVFTFNDREVLVNAGKVGRAEKNPLLAQ